MPWEFFQRALDCASDFLWLEESHYLTNPARVGWGSGRFPVQKNKPSNVETAIRSD